MHSETTNPALGGAGLAKASSLAGMSCEHTTPITAINKLRVRFGLSASVAEVIAHLAGLGPDGGRS